MLSKYIFITITLAFPLQDVASSVPVAGVSRLQQVYNLGPRHRGASGGVRVLVSVQHRAFDGHFCCFWYFFFPNKGGVKSVVCLYLPFVCLFSLCFWVSRVITEVVFLLFYVGCIFSPLEMLLFGVVGWSQCYRSLNLKSIGSFPRLHRFSCKCYMSASHLVCYLIFRYHICYYILHAF